MVFCRYCPEGRSDTATAFRISDFANAFIPQRSMTTQLARCLGQSASLRIANSAGCMALASRARRNNVNLLLPGALVRSFGTTRNDRATSYMPVPFITESIGGMTHTTDLWSRLLKERILLLNGPVEDQGSAQIVASMLFLEADNPERPISLYINSPGGSVTAGLAIYDTMQYIQAEVSTIVIGQAASMGSLLSCGGAPGKRYALPHASYMLHQPSGGYAGQAADIAIHAKEILRVRDSLNKIYKSHLDQAGKQSFSLEEIERLLDRDTFLSAQEACDMGLVDEILDRRVKPSDDVSKT